MQKIKKPVFLITYGLILFFILLNFKVLTSFTTSFVALISPFIWGLALAYLLNIPYTYIVEHLLHAKKEEKHFRKKKAFAIVLSYILFILIIILSASLLVPQLIESVNEFISNFSGYYTSLESLFTQLGQKIQLTASFWSDLQNIIISYKQQLMQIVNSILPSIINVATGTANGIFNVIFTLILSAYFLASKEKLGKLIKNSVEAFANQKTISYLGHVLDLSNETFRGFIVGQLTDALIVGIITFIGSSIFNFPYPILIGFIAGITNIIPVLGPFIGAVPCFFIILMAAPDKAFFYLIFVVILQQVDGNFICPKIVGDSIGLDGIWVIFAVIVGGGLFGIIGSFLFVPVFAILFKLYNEYLAKRLEAKRLKAAPSNADKA